MKRYAYKSGRINLVAAVVMVVALSTASAGERSEDSFYEMIQTVSLVPEGVHDSDLLAKVTLAVDNIKRMGLPEAQSALNEALQLNPRHSYLHFLNGFVYHLQARQGDSQKGELALEGYQQALRIDRSNWIAQEFLGLAYMDFNRFDQAQLAFSEALMLRPDSMPSIYGLMTASYLNGDARTACLMADQYLTVSDAPPQWFLQSSIPVYASCGHFARANWVRTALVQEFGHGPVVERLDHRLEQWKSFYAEREQSPVSGFKAGFNLTQDNNSPLVLAQAFTVPDMPSTPSTDSIEPDSYAEDDSVNSYSESYTYSESETKDETSTEVLAPAVEAETGPRSLLVDVVLLSTQELMATTKGVNLLNALTLQLGSISGNLPGYSRIQSSSELTGAGTTTSTSITRAVTIPALTYSLNIANANNSVNEVLARPTLAAIEGLPSEFFSGTNLSAGVVSTSQEGGTTIVPLEKRFGIQLAITPDFLSQGRVQLKVEAQRTSLNASSENPRVAYQIEIGETTANAHVVMNMGETLVLSGLSEKSSASTRDGVPVLQDIPIIQYLFSNKRTNELQRSVLILVTPRPTVLTSDGAAGDTESMAAQMKQLRQRLGYSDKIPAHIEAILTQLQGSDYFREFRQGDVSLERWDHMGTTGDRLKEAIRFLYY